MWVGLIWFIDNMIFGFDELFFDGWREDCDCLMWIGFVIIVI